MAASLVTHHLLPFISFFVSPFLITSSFYPGYNFYNQYPGGNMPRKTVSSAQAPKAIGPYSHAVWTGNLLYCSGQTPIDPATGKLIDGDIGEQTQQAFNNLEAVLQDAGLSMDHVIKVNIYLTSMSDFAGMNTVYQTRFSAPYPARTTVAVAALPLDARVEIELVAEIAE
jgi:2-iminobutanoate/2-iminopropanoate deaminase